MVKTSPSNAGGMGSTPGWGARIPHALGSKFQNIRQNQYCNKLKTFKNVPCQSILKIIKNSNIYKKNQKLSFPSFVIAEPIPPHILFFKVKRYSWAYIISNPLAPEIISIQDPMMSEGSRALLPSLFEFIEGFLVLLTGLGIWDPDTKLGSN